jgi:hypothetical protein
VADARLTAVRRDQEDPLRRSVGGTQGAAGGEQILDVGHIRVFVDPRRADDAFAVDQEDRPSRDVPEASELLGDPECTYCVAVEVREETEIEIECLRPGDVRVRRVAGDPDRLNLCCVEFVSPVTQELELVRSGG